MEEIFVFEFFSGVPGPEEDRRQFAFEKPLSSNSPSVPNAMSSPIPNHVHQFMVIIIIVSIRAHQSTREEVSPTKDLDLRREE